MEIKKELYQKTFSRLKFSPELGKEILAMTGKTRKPKKFILRRVIVAAAVMALLIALAMGANAATGGELFRFSLGNLEKVIPMDSGRYAYFYRNGDKLSVLVRSEELRGTETETIPATEDKDTYRIIALASGSSEDDEPTISLVTLKIVSAKDGTTAHPHTSTIMVTDSGDSNDGTHRVVYAGDTVKLIPAEEDDTAKYSVADNVVKIIAFMDDDVVSVEVQDESSGDSDDEKKTPIIVVKSN